MRSESIFCCPRTFLECFPFFEDVRAEVLCDDFVFADVAVFGLVLLLTGLFLLVGLVAVLDVFWARADEQTSMALAATPNAPRKRVPEPLIRSPVPSKRKAFPLPENQQGDSTPKSVKEKPSGSRH